MTITHKLKLDLQRKGELQRIDVVQGDALTRQVDLVLENGGKPWLFPICEPVARYCKPDGTMGVYDTLPTGTPAFSIIPIFFFRAIISPSCPIQITPYRHPRLCS